ncbi:MAG: CinA family protein [Desulfovibrio sp.]|jgi:PncC family amidohydrolase|nr:CinA family protein [Desulfovibrio sp.]
MFSPSILEAARQVVQSAKGASLRLGTVETVTAGLVAAAVASVPGASDVLERGFILYGYGAKSAGLGIPADLAGRYGAVSAEITSALAAAFFTRGEADLSLAVTGYAGPGGGAPDKPVGTVFIAACRRCGTPVVERHLFGGDRDDVRAQAVESSLHLVLSLLRKAKFSHGGVETVNG